MKDDLRRPTWQHVGPIALVCAFAFASLLVRLLSPGVPETGDGVFHWQHARYAWAHPQLLLEHWGKPLFTLLASPFAQVGLWGTAFFNALSAALSALLIARMVSKQRSWFAWAVPFMLFLAPQYAHVLIAGMTEVLFGLVAIIVVYLLAHERFKAAALVASFLPFARPEWIGVLPFVALWLAWCREWRVIPWLLCGSVVYGLAGWPYYGDPLWFFTHDPYAGNSSYGTGEIRHYVQQSDNILGRPLKIAVLCAIVAWPLLWWKEKAERNGHLRMLVLTLFPALLILIFHTWAWWKGGHGSLGLIRVLATTVPLLVLFTGHVFASCWRAFMPKTLDRVAFFIPCLLGYAWAAQHDLRKWEALPIPVEVEQAMVDRNVDRLARAVGDNVRFYYQMPYIAAAIGADPWDEDRCALAWSLEENTRGLNMHEGEVLLWDAHFCANEGGLQRDSLLMDHELRVLDVITPEERVDVLGGNPLEIIVFRRERTQRSMRTDTLFALGSRAHAVVQPQADPLIELPDAQGVQLGAGEFPFTFEDLPINGKGHVMDELVVRGELAATSGEGPLRLVYTGSIDGAQVLYREADLAPGPFELRIRAPHDVAGAGNKLYFWNRSGAPFTVTRLDVLRVGLVQQ